MSDTAVADEPKKEEPKELKTPDHTFNERVTTKVWVEQGKQSGFQTPAKNVWALRREVKDLQDGGKVKLQFIIHDGGNPNAFVGKKSVIIDKDGNEYECAEGAERVWFVKPLKKPVEKKN